MKNADNDLKAIISHAKEYGYIFPSSEIYDGLNAVYDYGQNGVELKKNIVEYWWKSMVQMHENIVGIDSAIFMNPTTWEASGHTEAFNDPLIDNRDSKKRYRADVLIEDYVEKINSKIEKEISKASKKLGEDFDRSHFINNNPNVLRYEKDKEDILNRMSKSLEKEDLNDIKLLIEELGISCPISGTKNWTDVRQFNLMFKTALGSITEGATDLYLRPETAQGIFVNFLNVQKTGRMKIPFGIAQVGKAFRNEIVARQFIFRMREFEQMEMQFFIHPDQCEKWFEYWKEKRLKWHTALGIDPNNYRFHEHKKLAHYSNMAVDIEFKFPFGTKELEGIHSRTNFDLMAHERYSGKKIKYFDSKTEESYTPFVIETSIGLDRMFLAVFSNSLKTEHLEDNSTRTVLSLPKVIAPIKVAILPLVKSSELREMATKIAKDLKLHFNVTYDEKDSIGKRYRRQDAQGTPLCITVDHDSLEDDSVTLRFRDSMKQQRVSTDNLHKLIYEEVDMTNILKKI
ncbi:glycine--tRNA ligase [Ichthyobacterium seriolicida]|uniref:glycine--tRNA ligase n=1 Tax=Ichthyobacterium seriolicida TaxID=242600 RepID=A0A1J1EAA4_9FLAO|nr:glycine--tRNA ligase [Ichthyobacterium seriolicida]BAV94448.1 glycyl-tRNA synthetase [Ichthyobacterium seriolicida]